MCMRAYVCVHVCILEIPLTRVDPPSVVNIDLEPGMSVSLLLQPVYCLLLSLPGRKAWPRQCFAPCHPVSGTHVVNL